MTLGLAALLPASLIVLGACASAPPPRSPGEIKADALAASIVDDPVAWEMARENALHDAEVRDALMTRIFDGIVASDVAMKDAERRQDGSALDAARARRARYFAEYLRTGELGARHALHQASSAGVRVAVAMEALAKIDAATLETPLREALDDPESAVRRGALRAIAASPDRASKLSGDVERKLKDPEWTVRKEAAATLAVGRGAEGANAALARALSDPNALVAREAAVTLGKRRAMGEIEPLIGYLARAKAAGDPHGIEAAVGALRTLSGRDYPPDPEAWRQWMRETQPDPPASAPAANAPEGSAESPAASAPRTVPR